MKLRYLLFVVMGIPRLASAGVVVIPTSEKVAQQWEYTTNQPAPGWSGKEFDASGWKSGEAPFGNKYDHVRTPWMNSPGDIWLRREVTLPATIPTKLSVMVAHDDEAEVYINGVLASKVTGATGDYEFLPILSPARAVMRGGEKCVIAVHCHDDGGGELIDVGIVEDDEVAGNEPWKASGDVATWKQSTASHLWVDREPVKFTSGGNAELQIEVDPTKTYQSIEGWGGCFNERGWRAVGVLDEAAREKTIRSLFDAKNGLRLNIARSPIGASDYAIDPYSLDDTPGDFAMEHFSIARDREKLIPFIKSAMAILPGLKVWGVPWSPPGWMKDNNRMVEGGHLKTDPATMKALALYFEKYVQAYRAEGIDLYAVMPQNEPTAWTNYPSCVWTGEQLHEFIGKYLGPQFEADKVAAEIWLGTINSAQWDFVGSSVEDPQTLKYLSGVGFQYNGLISAKRLHLEKPQMNTMQTETACGDHENDWNYAEGQYRLIQKYLMSGVRSYMLWNMVLDERGSNWNADPKSLGWQQCSPIVINSQTKEVIYNPEYFGFEHFSYFVRPGAKRVEVTGSYGEKMAFRNADGSVVIVVQNSISADLNVLIRVADREMRVKLEGHSWNTFVVR